MYIKKKITEKTRRYNNMWFNKNVIFKFFSSLVLFFMLWAISTSIFSPRIGMIFSLFRNNYSYKVILPINIICFIFSIFIYFLIIQWLRKKSFPVLTDKFTYIFLTIELVKSIILCKILYNVLPVSH